MADLQGRRIVVLEARLPSELGALVTRHGGQPIAAPALREVPIPMRQEVRDLVDAVCSRAIDMVVFLTGVGARALIGAADELGRRDAFLDALRHTTIACRGPKPVAVMRTHDVPIALVAPEPYTSEDLAGAIVDQGWDLRGKRVALQHYGEVNTYLRTRLQEMGARITEVSLYTWALPEDVRPVEDAVRTVVARHADAVLFTTQSQVRNLFRIAEGMDQRDALTEALTRDVVAAPVGPVCARALINEGVTPHLEPEHPKMGPLVLALAAYFEAQESTATGPLASGR